MATIQATGKEKTRSAQPAPGQTKEDQLARLAMSPIVGNAKVAQQFSKGTLGTIDLVAATAEMRRQCDGLAKNGQGGLEEMLLTQAVALNTVFGELSRRAALNLGEYMQATETYLRLALKAQAQCRATIETLAEIRNPRPVAFVKQANIAHGPQQVNNAPPPLAHGKTEKSANELLEHKHEQWLDTGTPGTSGGDDPAMATLAKVHRPRQH